MKHQTCTTTNDTPFDLDPLFAELQSATSRFIRSLGLDEGPYELYLELVEIKSDDPLVIFHYTQGQLDDTDSTAPFIRWLTENPDHVLTGEHKDRDIEKPDLPFGGIQIPCVLSKENNACLLRIAFSGANVPTTNLAVAVLAACKFSEDLCKIAPDSLFNCDINNTFGDHEAARVALILVDLHLDSSPIGDCICCDIPIIVVYGCSGEECLAFQSFTYSEDDKNEEGEEDPAETPADPEEVPEE
ncbi:hypothetical protein FWD07_02910 [Candidatus Saccharibacteria bacterium]|nr:hypothetical protein [Candidatus Saccharibacteria bacterium]